MTLPSTADVQASHYNNPQFLFSTRSSNKVLLEHLKFVPSGIKNVCEIHNLILNETDVQWLAEHEGRYQLYFYPQGKNYKDLMQSKSMRDKPLDDAVAQLLNKRHTVAGIPPWFAGFNQTPNYKDIQECSLRGLWNFLAIIGDYMSMLLLLPHPPEDCPSIKHIHIKAYVLHCFNFPNKPLYNMWDTEDPTHRMNDQLGRTMFTNKRRYVLQVKLSQFICCRHQPPL
jgi:hypothetical protein